MQMKFLSAIICHGRGGRDEVGGGLLAKTSINKWGRKSLSHAEQQ